MCPAARGVSHTIFILVRGRYPSIAAWRGRSASRSASSLTYLPSLTGHGEVLPAAPPSMRIFSAVLGARKGRTRPHMKLSARGYRVDHQARHPLRDCAGRSWRETEDVREGKRGRATSGEKQGVDEAGVRLFRLGSAPPAHIGPRACATSAARAAGA